MRRIPTTFRSSLLNWSFCMPVSFWAIMSLIADNTPAVIAWTRFPENYVKIHISNKTKIKIQSLTFQPSFLNFPRQQTERLSKKQETHHRKDFKKSKHKEKEGPLFSKDVAGAVSSTVLIHSLQSNPFSHFSPHNNLFFNFFQIWKQRVFLMMGFIIWLRSSPSSWPRD